MNGATKTTAILFTCTAYLGAWAQGTFEQLKIMFEGPPEVSPGTAVGVQQYFEAGLWFAPLLGGDGFGRIGNYPQGRPDNGTAYLQAALGDSLTFGTLNGSPFDFVAVDLAEYSTVVPDPVTVRFVGYRHDGSIVTSDVTTDGIMDGTGPLTDFQTFFFGPEFSNLDRVEIPTSGWSLDNLVVLVPEPATWALAMAGGLLFGARYFRKGDTAQ